MSEQPPISDYALIGDCLTAALVSKHGSIDWLCWPRFDSPSLFGALVDPSAGRFAIRPTGRFEASRRYRPHTAVLETRFRTDAGEAILVDLMPVAPEFYNHLELLPGHDLLRLARCERGQIELEVLFDPRPDYGRRRPRIRDRGRLGIEVQLGAGASLILRSNVALAPRPEGGFGALVRLHAGEELEAHLVYTEEAPAVLPALGPSARAFVDRTETWWRDFAARCTYRGRYREAVLRSAITLKLLTYAPSGAIVAAPTTSLPERPGGDLNWDYRYCWLRDASFTSRALFGLGFHGEARAFVSWLLHTTRLTRPALQVLYDVYGRTPPRERPLPHLRGYRGARPVRIGNGAAEQKQLDVYGEVIDATTTFIEAGGELDRETAKMLRGFGNFVCQHWDEPDEGIWEVRSGPRRHAYSRLMCWVALDRLIKLTRDGHLDGRDLDKWCHARSQIRDEINQLFWSRTAHTYVRETTRPLVDATLLLLPWYGFERADSERMCATYRRILFELETPNRLLYRYDTGDSPGEGAFGVCCFWLAEFLALGGGTYAQARRTFEHVLGFANDVGLYAEEMDPVTGEALGNFPQAFTHIGLINAALTIQAREEKARPNATRAAEEAHQQ